MKIRTRSALALCCSLVLCIGAITILPSCESAETTRLNIESSERRLADLDAQISSATSTLTSLTTSLDATRDTIATTTATANALPADSPERIALTQTLAQLQTGANDVSSAITNLTAQLKAAQAQSTELTGAIESAKADYTAATSTTNNTGDQLAADLAKIVPGAGSLVAAIALGWKNLKLGKANRVLRAGSTKVVTSIDALAEAVPEFAAILAKNADFLRRKQGTEGNLIVDLAQGKDPTGDNMSAVEKLKIAA